MDINRPVQLFERYPGEFSIANRSKYLDGYNMEGINTGIQEFLRLRLYALLQRPNAMFRSMVRSFLGNIHILDPNGSYKAEHHIKNKVLLICCILDELES